jgi:hypothetical protein
VLFNLQSLSLSIKFHHFLRHSFLPNPSVQHIVSGTYNILLAGKMATKAAYKRVGWIGCVSLMKK